MFLLMEPVLVCASALWIQCRCECLSFYPVLVCVSVHEFSVSVCLLYRCNVGVCPVDLILVYVSNHCPLL